MNFCKEIFQKENVEPIVGPKPTASIEFYFLLTVPSEGYETTSSSTNYPLKNMHFSLR